MKMLLAGEWVDRDQKIEVPNPYDGSVIDTVPQATPEDVETAIQSAERGFKIMRDLPAWDRYEILMRAAGLLRERSEDLARTLALEVGKTITEARTEVDRTWHTLTLSAEEAKRIHGETLPFDAAPTGKGKFGFYLRVPCGVVLAITPFNFPLNLANHKLAPAFAAGCSVIHKPATKTPLTNLKMAQVYLDAGLPPEALNVITGRGEGIGEALVCDPRIRKISFTGSAEVGKRICHKAGLKKVTMELGSDSAVVVMPDADLDFAAARVKVGGYAVAGQVCISTQRVLVGKPAFDDVLGKLQKLVADIKVGDPLKDDTQMGPMITEQAARETEQRIQEAVAAGAKLVSGGGRSGTMVEPTILVDVPKHTFLGSQEAFAPLINVVATGDIEAAIGEVNNTAYGLQAGIFTRDMNAAFRFIREADVGGALVNELPTFRIDLMPYGGVKDSGMGREGPRFAVEEMTEIKLAAIHLG